MENLGQLPLFKQLILFNVVSTMQNSWGNGYGHTLLTGNASRIICMAYGMNPSWSMKIYHKRYTCIYKALKKHVCAQDIVDYLDHPEVKLCLWLKKTISLATAQHWMAKMGYWWTKVPSGQSVDGHERPDVVSYCQDTFLPAWARLELTMRAWKNGKQEILVPAESNWPNGKDDGPWPFEVQFVLWFHDESIYYANDCQKICWSHKDEKAVPQHKGEGALLMVTDFVLADYSWLWSPNGKKEAHDLFKAGKGQDGYNTNEEIIEQAEKAMEILEEYFPSEQHCLVYDNATTHLKQEDNMLSASKMPKNTPKEGNNWGVETTVIGKNSKPIPNPILSMWSLG
jgi:hypothetical protein